MACAALRNMSSVTRFAAEHAGVMGALHRLDECRERRAVLREGTLKAREIAARRDEQPLDVEEGVAPPLFVYIHAGPSHGRPDHLCNPGSRRTSTEKQE